MMKARKAGRCPSCKEPIKVGDEIERARGRWRHLACAKKLTQANANAKPPTPKEVKEAQATIDRVTEMMLGRGAPVKLDDLGFNRMDYDPSCAWVDGQTKYRKWPGGWCTQAQRLWKYRGQIKNLGEWEAYEQAKALLERWADTESQTEPQGFQDGPQAASADHGGGKAGAGLKAVRSGVRPEDMFSDLGGGSGAESHQSGRAPSKARNRPVRPRKERGGGKAGSRAERSPGPRSGVQAGPSPGAGSWACRIAKSKGGTEVIYVKTPPPWVDTAGTKEAIKRVDGRRWDPFVNEWYVPLSSGIMLACELEVLGGEPAKLAARIRELPGVSEVGESVAARAQLSRAVSMDSLGPEGMAYVREVERRLEPVLPDGFTLYPFQSVGVGFMVAAKGQCIVGDEMGCGKTIETLAYLAHEHLAGRPAFPAVVICPAVVKLNWAKEARLWLGKLGVKVFVCDSMVPAPSDAHVVIINYDLMRRRIKIEKVPIPGTRRKKDEVKEVIGLPSKPATVICDEFHKVKNPKAQRTQATLAYAKLANGQVLLSGTPLLNRPIELFPGLNTIAPNTFPNFFGYAKRYCGAENNGYGWDFSGSSNLDELRDRLRTLMLRRVKTDVLKELPAKRRAHLTLELSNRETYDKAEEDLLKWLKGEVFDEMYQKLSEEGSQEADVQAMKAAHAKVSAAMRAEHLVRMNALRILAGRGKAKAAAEWVQDFLDEDPSRKLVVFAHHLEVIETIRSTIAKVLPDVGICVLTGQTPNTKRQELVESFQGDPDVRLFISSTTAGGVGITLTAAQDVLFLEREWVPGDEEQAEDRCHRIGQEGSVTAWYAVAENSIDADFAALVSSKRAVFKEVMGDGEEKEEQGNLLGDVTRRLVERRIRNDQEEEQGRIEAEAERREYWYVFGE